MAWPPLLPPPDVAGLEAFLGAGTLEPAWLLVSLGDSGLVELVLCTTTVLSFSPYNK